MTNNNLNNVNNVNVNNNEPVNKLMNNKNNNNNQNQNQNTNFWYWVGGIVVLSGLIFYYSKNYRKSTNTKTDNKDEK
jgi:heme/copper-type cytochrome/quinol oxidase subunit 2